MNKIKFVIEKNVDEKNGQELDCVVKYVEDAEGKTGSKEIWCSILDLDRLFDTCQKRWAANWNLDKVCAAVAESDIE